MTPQQSWERNHGVCSRCNGHGSRNHEYYTEQCRHCDGTGSVPTMRNEWRPHDPQKGESDDR